MRFVGIDVAAERHVVAIVDEAETVRLKPTAFTEDAEGYQNLWSLLGPPSVDTSKPAIRGRGKTGQRERARKRESCTASDADRASVS